MWNIRPHSQHVCSKHQVVRLNKTQEKIQNMESFSLEVLDTFNLIPQSDDYSIFEKLHISLHKQGDERCLYIESSGKAKALKLNILPSINKPFSKSDILP